MTSEPINIIFTHSGKCDYLRYSLAAAHRSNPKANIILIDDTNDYQLDYVKRFNINDYSQSAKEFTKIYQHLYYSANPTDFELFYILTWFERWFVISTFIKANGINNFFYADSDVLIFSNLAEEWPKFSKFSFTLSEGTSGHSSFWNSAEAISDFCQFLMDVYSRQNQVSYGKMLDFWNNYQLQKKEGGVCDMTLLRLYSEAHPGKVGETSVIIDGSTYDDNLSSSAQGGNNYQKSIFGIKKIFWKNMMPYGKDASGKLIRFNTLHFQGKKKIYMAKALEGKKLYAWKLLAREKSINLLRKINFFNFYLRAKKIFK
jgi:hypothetical protein